MNESLILLPFMLQISGQIHMGLIRLLNVTCLVKIRISRQMINTSELCVRAIYSVLYTMQDSRLIETRVACSKRMAERLRGTQ